MAGRAGAISVEKAVDILTQHTQAPKDGEPLPLMDALGRTVYKTIFARMDQPPFDRSPLDGYAVHHADIPTASRAAPAVLEVAQRIYAGDAPLQPLSRGQAALVMTGAPLPEGASCVVRQEDTDMGDPAVEIYASHKEHDNYCFRGEDIHVGQPLAWSGEQLDPARIGIFASQGMGAVPVYPKPRVRIFSTGDELAGVAEDLPPGKIYDSNRYTLSLRAKELGAEVLPGKSLPDELAVLCETILQALPAGDLVITTGGVSVGAHDYLPQVGQAIGAKTLFGGIAAKPGGGALALEKGGKLILCLSGNPFAAFATFELLAAPVIRKLAGRQDFMGKRQKGTLREDFGKASRGRRFVRARLEGGEVIFPSKTHSAGVLSSLVDCNCMIDIPAGTPQLKAGEVVEVLLL